jgi:hypothetical protein
VLFLVVALSDSAEEPDQVVVGIDTDGGLWVGAAFCRVVVLTSVSTRRTTLPPHPGRVLVRDAQRRDMAVDDLAELGVLGLLLGPDLLHVTPGRRGRAAELDGRGSQSGKRGTLDVRPALPS